METTSTLARHSALDVYRGLAVALMIIFHFCWDLRDFGFVNFDDQSDFWITFRAIIVFMFVSAVGCSSYLANLYQQPFRRFLKNQAKVLLAALLISIGTYLALPEQWVFFGILHFIFIAGWILRPISGHPILSCALGTCLVAISYWLGISAASSHRWFIHNFNAPDATLDFVNPLLWLGVALIGPIFGYLNWHSIKLPNQMALNTLAFLGRHALPTYLMHQLILYPIVIGAYFLLL